MCTRPFIPTDNMEIVAHELPYNRWAYSRVLLSLSMVFTQMVGHWNNWNVVAQSFVKLCYWLYLYDGILKHY